MRVKYPRTFHLPFSKGRTSDDKVLKTTEHFVGQDVVITKKMDGENTSLYRDGYHARSIDSRFHPSRAWLARFHAQIAHEIPEGWRICGENVYARHSICYESLPSYFLGFSIWNEHNVSLSWSDTLEMFELIGVTPVDTLYDGAYSDEICHQIIHSLDLNRDEGFVVRLTDSFAYHDFSKSVAKFVRASHVCTDKHWMHSEITVNKLKEI